jgi:3-methyladenine DNA glycosylase AlkD
MVGEKSMPAVKTQSDVSCAAILAELKAKGSEKARVTYARHGHALERTYGASVADMKAIAKAIRGEQELAYELYESGMMEAMYLAGIVADGAKMTEARLQAWARGADGLPMIAEYTVPWVTVEHPSGRKLAMEWIGSAREFLAASGWRTYSGLVATMPDDRLNLDEIGIFLDKVVAEVHTAPNQVRQPMNSFVISVALYVEPMSAQARSAARKMGAISVDVGDTACEVPLASAYIDKAEAAGRLGKKRKTIRC